VQTAFVTVCLGLVALLFYSGDCGRCVGVIGRTRTLDSHASRLRRKLDPERGRYVVNVWGVGYRLIER
jgi:Transcriptional regulatory protein, C terminal